MDFSKVKLADFAQARLRDVAGEKLAEQQEGSSSSVPSKEKPSDVVACAERYKVTLTPLNREAEKHSDVLQDVLIDENSGYTLATFPEGILIWKQGSDNALLFPVTKPQATSALFVPCAPDVPSLQPGLITVDLDGGHITYWESINRALGVTSAESSSLQNLGTAGNGRVPLGRQEMIEFVESVDPFGLVVSTSEGRFFLINLRDDMGKRKVTVASMSIGTGFLSRLRSIGAFARDVSSLRAGKLVKEGRNRELFVITKFGDTSIWHVGNNGYAELKAEHKFGDLLHHQMNLLYPNCLSTLQVHDIDSQHNEIQVLASFAPQPYKPLRYFVVLTNIPNNTPSVRRLQSYISETGSVAENTSLRIHEGNLVAAFEDAITIFNKVDNVENSSSAEKPWEETLTLKKEARLLGMVTKVEDYFVIPTSRGILNIHLQNATTSVSTSKERLAQAVFEAQPQNPLDLTTWPSFESRPDPDASVQLAREIANAQSPYIPARLPNLRDHLALRVNKLKALYEQSPSTEVREIAQAAVASLDLLDFYERQKDSSVCEAIDSEVKAIKPDLVNLTELLHGDITIIPTLLANLASRQVPGMTDLVLAVFRICSSNGLGLPEWASQGSLREALETLTSQAADSRDPELLAQTTEILCAVYVSSDPSEGAADNETIKRLLRQLSDLKDMSSVAIKIATTYKVFSALAPLEVAVWVADCRNNPAGGPNSEGLKIISEHIGQFGTPYANAVFDTCIKSGNSDLLVEQLAPLHNTLVREYLAANKLHQIAWTLNPGTPESTEELRAATENAQTPEQVRLFASLYKLSAFTNQPSSVPDAQMYLDLVAAHTSLCKQLLANNNLPESFTNSPTVQSALPKLKEQFLDRQTAVDLLALAPPQAIPDQNDNFILAFRLVDALDVPRQRLLVQQLICNTNWDRIASAAVHERGKRFKQSLYFVTFALVAPAYANMIRYFGSSFVQNQPSEIVPEVTGPWSPFRVQESNNILLTAQSIVQKYKVDQLLEEFLPRNPAPVPVGWPYGYGYYQN